MARRTFSFLSMETVDVEEYMQILFFLSRLVTPYELLIMFVVHLSDFWSIGLSTLANSMCYGFPYIPHMMRYLFQVSLARQS